VIPYLRRPRQEGLKFEYLHKTTAAFAYNTHFAIYNGSVAKIVTSILIFGNVRKSPEDG
jgi:hypothetical protein